MSSTPSRRTTKYAPLADYLRNTGLRHVPMTFAEIERLCAAPLPPSARRHRAWWSNNPSNSVITHAWLDAGYVSADVDMAGERLVFRRREGAAPTSPPPTRDDTPGPAASRQGDHPLWGALTGTLHIRPQTDLTAPTAPEAEDAALAKFDHRAAPR